MSRPRVLLVVEGWGIAARAKRALEEWEIDAAAVQRIADADRSHDAVIVIGSEHYRRRTAADVNGDDFIDTDCRPHVVAERVRRVLRAKGCQMASHVHAGELAIDIDASSVSYRGRRTDLHQRELAVLTYLARRGGVVVAKNELAGIVGTRNMNVVEAAISTLRRHVDRELITTLRGTGYRLELSNATERT